MNIHKFNVSVIILNQMPGKILKYHTHEKNICKIFAYQIYEGKRTNFYQVWKIKSNKFPFPKNAIYHIWLIWSRRFLNVVNVLSQFNYICTQRVWSIIWKILNSPHQWMSWLVPRLVLDMIKQIKQIKFAWFSEVSKQTTHKFWLKKDREIPNAFPSRTHLAVDVVVLLGHQVSEAGLVGMLKVIKGGHPLSELFHLGQLTQTYKYRIYYF